MKSEVLCNSHKTIVMLEQIDLFNKMILRVYKYYQTDTVKKA